MYYDPELEDDVITLVDEDGEEVDLERLDNIEYDGTLYIIFATCEEHEVVIMRCFDDENGEQTFIPETDETIINKVFKVFQKRNSDIFFFFGDEEE